MIDWKKIEDRKWELKNNDIVLATIYHKPSGKYSLYVCTPLIFEKLVDVMGRTYLFPSLDEAKVGFEKLLIEKVLPWAQSVISFVYVQNPGLIGKNGSKSGNQA